MRSDSPPVVPRVRYWAWMRVVPEGPDALPVRAGAGRGSGGGRRRGGPLCARRKASAGCIRDEGAIRNVLDRRFQHRFADAAASRTTRRALAPVPATSKRACCGVGNSPPERKRRDSIPRPSGSRPEAGSRAEAFPIADGAALIKRGCGRLLGWRRMRAGRFTSGERVVVVHVPRVRRWIFGLPSFSRVVSAISSDSCAMRSCFAGYSQSAFPAALGRKGVR